MFYINKNPILASEMEVLTELKQQLALNGIMRFDKFVEGSSNIQFNCPIHNDGQESKPSCGIKTTNHGDTPAGTVHCFACGYTASLEEMISNCFGKNDGGVFGIEWLVKNFLTISVEQRKDIQLDMGRGVTVKKETEYISEEELASYRYYHPYMYKRKLTDELIEKFDVGYDPNFKLYDKRGNIKGVMRCITFPVRNIEGKTLFLGRRSVDTKFFHYPDGVEKPVYGLYELPKDAEEIIICESFLDAISCYKYDKPAVALIGTGTDFQYEQLKALTCRKFITALDPDKAGNSATIRLKKALGSRKLVTTYILPNGKDINDLTEEEFNNLDEIF